MAETGAKNEGRLIVTPTCDECRHRHVCMYKDKLYDDMLSSLTSGRGTPLSRIEIKVECELRLS